MNLIDLMEIGTLYDKGYYFMWQDIVLDARIDKNNFLQEVVNKCGQMYPATQTVASFKMMSEAFFKKWAYQISKLLDTQEFEYNPIWNRDGTIKELRHTNRDRSETVDEDIDTTTNTTTDSTNENTVSAYDSSTYQPYDKDVSHSTRDDSEKIDRDRDTDENETTVEDFIQTNQGNVGVTTTQSMINEERALYEFNIYDWIIKKYSTECFLRVW